MSDMTSPDPPDFEIATVPVASNTAVLDAAPADAGRSAHTAERAADVVAPVRAMTAAQTMRAGLAAARRNVRLVMLVWVVFLALAWVAALPAWRWFDRVLSLAPEGDRLLRGLNISVLRELSHYDRSPTVAIALGSAFMFFVIAAILNPFVAGGTLGVLRASATGVFDVGAARQGVTRHFVAAGVRHYWGFARILLFAGMLGGGVAMVLTFGFDAIVTALDERGFARASMWADNLMMLMWLIVFGLSSLIVDVARVFMLWRDDHRAAAAVRAALGFIRRNFGALITAGSAFFVLLGAAAMVYLLIAGSITPLSWGLIVFAIVWQQLFALARTALRVGLLGTLVTLVDARTPRPIEPPPPPSPPPVDVTPVDEPVYELPVLG